LTSEARVVILVLSKVVVVGVVVVWVRCCRRRPSLSRTAGLPPPPQRAAAPSRRLAPRPRTSSQPHLSLSSPPLFLSHRSRPAQLEALTLSRLSVAPSFAFSHSALKQPPPSATLPVSSPARPLSPPWVRLLRSCQHRRPHRLTPPLPIRPQVFPRCGSSNQCSS
jgi:hypothetical protein